MSRASKTAGGGTSVGKVCLAALGLIVGVYVFWRGVAGSSGLEDEYPYDDPALLADPELEAEDEFEGDLPVNSADDPVAHTGPAALPLQRSSTGDLLAGFGSHVIGATVPQVFAVELATGRVAHTAQGPAANMLAAPMGEMAPAARATAGWQGADPAKMHVTFVLCSPSANRAIVDGQILGVGDLSKAGIVLAIEPDGMRVARTGVEGSLFYPLGESWPREFAAELQRRVQQGSDGDSEGEPGDRSRSQVQGSER